MKKLFLFALTIFTISCIAQPTQKIVLKKGQKIKLEQVDKTTMRISAMGQSMDINSDNDMITLLEVKAIDDNKFTLSSTLKRIKMSAEMMGNSQSYDSDNPADKNSEMAKEFENKLNKPEEAIVDHQGKEINEKNKGMEISGNPMENMFKMIAAKGAVSSAFMLLPANASVGSSWSDSGMIETIKTLKTYTIKSISNDEAVIELKGTISGEKSADMQGMEMNVKMNSQLSGEILSDIKTGLVKRTNIITDMNNEVEMMGASNPMTGKVTTTIIASYAD